MSFRSCSQVTSVPLEEMGKAQGGSAGAGMTLFDVGWKNEGETPVRWTEGHENLVLHGPQGKATG